MSMPFITAPEKEKAWIEVRMWGGLIEHMTVHKTPEGAKRAFAQFCEQYTAEELQALKDTDYYSDNDEYMHLYDWKDRHTPEIVIQMEYVED